MKLALRAPLVDWEPNTRAINTGEAHVVERSDGFTCVALRNPAIEGVLYIQESDHTSLTYSDTAWYLANHRLLRCINTCNLELREI